MSGAKASGKEKKYFVYITAGILLNCLGRVAAVKCGCPAIIDTLGTVLAAYYGGIIPGVASAVLLPLINRKATFGRLSASLTMKS